MKDHEIWRSELCSEIRTIADEGELRRLWSGDDPNAISSLAEEVAHIFDDYNIEGFIATGPARARLDLEQFGALRKFRDEFATYIDGAAPKSLALIDHEQALVDPRWISVMNAAREFIVLLDRGGQEASTGREVKGSGL